jgi:ATP-dependent exoDNAse (exonuclease V) alpha subunit
LRVRKSVALNLVSRAAGRSVVAAAAYRSAEALPDHRIAQTFDYTHKPSVEHTEILAPAAAPTWVQDRTTLWNTVEQVERRKDAQLAREIELGLPVELTKDQQIHLLRDFAQRAFVSRGMVADIALHRDNLENPHAHLLLTTRTLTSEGFGPKQRDWNARAELLKWREQWADVANEHLLRAGLEIRIDHRTLEAQGIDLVPGRKIGVSAERQQQPDLPRSLADRIAEQREIAAENGRRILEDPHRALRALRHTQASFTQHDIAKFLHGRTDGAEQFQSAYLKVTAASADLTAEPSLQPTPSATDRLRQRADKVAERLAAERQQERTVQKALEHQLHMQEQQHLNRGRDISKQHELDQDHDLGLDL